jgi:hypothetical protein
MGAGKRRGTMGAGKRRGTMGADSGVKDARREQGWDST